MLIYVIEIEDSQVWFNRRFSKSSYGIKFLDIFEVCLRVRVRVRDRLLVVHRKCQDLKCKNVIKIKCIYFMNVKMVKFIVVTGVNEK
jgi:hypothetical protein